MENYSERTTQFLNDVGLNLGELIEALSKEASTLLNLSQEKQEEFNLYYDKLIKKDYSVYTKGKLLEKLSCILFHNCLFEIRHNCTTSTNEIDILVAWSESARVTRINQSFPCFGDYFLCECKNYAEKVGVTYIGKFASLLESARSSLGIMVSWEGITGSNWNDGVGLIKKLALSKRCNIIVIDKEDFARIHRKEVNIFKIVNDKFIALQNDIDFQQFILKHEAEGEFKKQTIDLN